MRRRRNCNSMTQLEQIKLPPCYETPTNMLKNKVSYTIFKNTPNLRMKPIQKVQGGPGQYYAPLSWSTNQVLLKLTKKKHYYDPDVKHALKTPSIYSYAPKPKPIEKSASKQDK